MNVIVFYVHKRNTVLFGAKFHKNYKYPTVLCAEFYTEFYQHLNLNVQSKDKAISLQAWTGPEGSTRLMFPDFKTIGTWKW